MAKGKKLPNLRNKNDEVNLQKLGNNLRQLREKKGISQEQLAKDAGLSRSYYTEVETGKRNISILNLLRIAQQLEVELSAFIRLKDFSKK